MAYRIIDDETALTIFEAIQQKSTRNFDKYDCLRQLPRHKINGELLFYLDELFDFAEKELSRSPSEALGEVLDLGLTAWFAGLDAAQQQKIGFSLSGGADGSPEAAAAAPGDTGETSDETDIDLAAENRRLAEALEAAAAEKVALKREIAHLEQVNEELADQQPQALSQPQGQQTPSNSGYLDQGAFSGYMALTSHSIAGASSGGGDAKKSAAPKKNKRRRKKRNGGAAQNGRPQ